VVAAEPDLKEVFELVVRGDLVGREVAVVVEDGLGGGVVFVERARPRRVEEECVWEELLGFGSHDVCVVGVVVGWWKSGRGWNGKVERDAAISEFLRVRVNEIKDSEHFTGEDLDWRRRFESRAQSGGRELLKAVSPLRSAAALQNFGRSNAPDLAPGIFIRAIRVIRGWIFNFTIRRNVILNCEI